MMELKTPGSDMVLISTWNKLGTTVKPKTNPPKNKNPLFPTGVLVMVT